MRREAGADVTFDVEAAPRYEELCCRVTLGWMSWSSQGVGEMVLAQGKESRKVMPWIGAVLA